MWNRMSTLLTLLAADAEREFPWWLILLVLVLIVIIVIWALDRNSKPSEELGVGHEPQHALHDEPAEPVRAAQVVESVRSERAIDPVILPVEPSAPDDLKMIEGIGPKIAGLLNEAGISTFAQLAAADVADLNALLEKASLRIANPATWPEQAALAARGDLDGLQALQDSLKGGRKAG